MKSSVGPGEVERFSSLIACRFGLQFEDAKRDFLAEVLHRRLQAQGDGCERYLRRLELGPSRAEIAALAQELTVPETHFFRNIDQFYAFSEVVLPERLRARAMRKRLRLLSAGCASGEEPYTIAILVQESLADPSWDVSIRAVDINPVMLEKAARGRFSTWALRETRPDVQRRWFRADGGELVLAESIRRSVKFEERNLGDEDPELWQPGSYDVVFCRNVMMYFTPAGASALVQRIARALAPNGYLFLGHAESLRGLSQDFHLRHTHGTFYYQRKVGPEQAVSRAPFDSVAASVSAPAIAAFIQDADTWVDAIGRAAERVRALTQVPAPPPAAAVIARLGWNPGLALDLLQQERFEEALDLVQKRPPEAAHDTDVLLLHAVLLTHAGQLTQAEEVCARLLAVDEMNAGAHYLLALCREAVGDRRDALDHDQAAVYLDPAFAMPRLHLGMLARRAGKRETAGQEFRQALVLLEREDASRLMLFGGGFNRETLLALCRAELRACAGRP